MHIGLYFSMVQIEAAGRGVHSKDGAERGVSGKRLVLPHSNCRCDTYFSSASECSTRLSAE